MSKNESIDYLAIGHVSRDVADNSAGEGDNVSYKPGGTVSFSSETAFALNCRTAALTSAASDYDLSSALPNSEVVCVESAESTTFSNIYLPEGRQQIVHGLAGWVSAEHLPSHWKTIPIVHLGPITNQIDPQLVHAFDGSLIGITPQGWMREWDERGYVSAIPMQAADILLPNADAVVIGVEDLVDDAQLNIIRAKTKLLVLTRSAQGCTIFQGDEVFDVPAPAVEEIEATGAGDIFATAFFVHLWRSHGQVKQAAEFANLVASCSVTQPTLDKKMDAIRQLQLNL